jgi:hypothetical protein
MGKGKTAENPQYAQDNLANCQSSKVNVDKVRRQFKKIFIHFVHSGDITEAEETPH